MSTKLISRISLAASLIGLFAALPSFGQQYPALQVTVNGDSATIYSNGTVTFAGGLTSGTCAGGCSTGSVSFATPGQLVWTGTIDGFTLFGLMGETTPSLPGLQTDVQVATIAPPAAGGTIRIAYTATGFMDGQHASTLTVQVGAAASQTYSAYVDNNNTPFGTTGSSAVLADTYTGNSNTTVMGTSGPSSDPNGFSMTTVETITFAANSGTFTNDIGFQVAPYPPLTLQCPPSTPTGTVGTPYSQTFAVNGGQSPYMFSILSGSLPPGLALNSSTGVISGTPSTAGPFMFVGLVKDASGATATTPTGASCQVTIDTGTTVLPPPTTLQSGDTATIGFWNNKNGQALILSAGTTPTLGAFLASYSNIFGSVGSDTNTQIAALFRSYFSVKGQKTSAQVLAGALACYFNSTGSPQAAQYGFNLSGTCNVSYDVGSYASLLGLTSNAPSTVYTIGQILAAANTLAAPPHGWSTAVANALNVIFSNINQGGDIK